MKPLAARRGDGVAWRSKPSAVNKDYMISKSINKDYFCSQMKSVYLVLHTSNTILKPPVLACHVEPGSPPV